MLLSLWIAKTNLDSVDRTVGNKHPKVGESDLAFLESILPIGDYFIADD